MTSAISVAGLTRRYRDQVALGLSFSESVRPAARPKPAAPPKPPKPAKPPKQALQPPARPQPQAATRWSLLQSLLPPPAPAACPLDRRRGPGCLRETGGLSGRKLG